MKKKIAALALAIGSTFLTAGFASCNMEEFNPEELIIDLTGQELSLDLSEFNPIVAYKSELSYETIKINYSQLMNGVGHYEASLSIEPQMIVSGGETDTIGDHQLVLSHAGKEFVVDYTVKYQVDFVAKGEVFASQFVMNAGEIELPEETPNIEGFVFAYWKTAIPAEITDNLSMEAHYYNTALMAPALDKFERVYDPNATLGDLTLPSNENGAWEFVDALNTPIGNVGENSFNVRFVPATDELSEKQDVVKVKVTPRPITFTVGENLFVYDGEEHFPVYTTSEDVAVEVLGRAETNAGTYTFALLPADSNYQGLYSGSYTITKPDVTVTVKSASMKYGETIPEIEYTVEGFAKVDVLGIQAQRPNVTAIGEYELNVVVSNTNVNAVVVGGKLTVAKGDLAEVSNPTLSADNSATPAIYEYPLSSVTFTNDYRGVWAWKNPEAIIDSVDSYTATAVFTPNNSNYNVIERELTITNFDKRTLEITIISSNYTYSGNEYTIVFEIAEGKNVQVDGVLRETNAGTYETTLSINDKYYKGTKDATLVIEKATPETDFSADYTVVWNNFLALSDITLANGYVWDAPETSLKDCIGTYEYAATFVPEDAGNFVTVPGTFTVTVEKAEGVLHGVKPSYTFTYNKDSAQTLSGITSTPADGTVKYTYVFNGDEVSEMKAAGTYQVTINLFESAYHTSAVATTEVIIDKVVNVDAVTLEQSAVYGDLMSTLVLPTNEFGTWAWEGVAADATVGNAGQHTYVAVYTPNDPANYEARKVDVSVLVTKQTVYEPTVQQQTVYTGETFTALTVAVDALYTADGSLTATDAGDYTITLTLKDPANYKWSGSSEATVEIAYAITQAPNEITSLTIEGWMYNEEAKNPAVEAIFGADTVVYYYAPFGSNAYTTDVPTTAGTYNLKAVIAATANYAQAEKTIMSAFTIAKDTPVVVFEEHYTRTWYEGLKLSAIALEEGFAWKQDATLEVGADQVFAVVYTPADTTNYNTVEGTFTVTVNKRLVTLSGVANSYSHVYNGNAFTVSGITATPNVELVYTYSSGNAPVNAGEYTVTITLADTAHYTFGTASECVVRTINIEKANVDTIVSYNAVYGDTLGSLSLPTSTVGVWSWKTGNDTLVGDAGERSHVAVFTSSSDNYNSIERAFVVTVAKKEISKPTILENSFVYTGSAFTVLGNTDLYEVSGNVQTEVGEYTVTVTLVDPANYAWTAESVDPTFEITQATTVIEDLAIVGWTYGEQANTPTATTNFGTVAYLYAGEDGVYTAEVPENAGNYSVKAYVVGNNNYTSAETSAVSFVIAKAAYTETLASETYTVDWFDGITLAAIVDLPEGYSWTDSSVALVAGTTANYGVTYVDLSGNYQPAYGEFAVTVNKLGAAISVTTAFDGATTTVYTHTYNGGAFTLTASASHGEATPVYTVDGVVVDAISLTQAGSYEVIVTLSETAHYLAASWTETVTIEKANVTYVLPTWNPGAESTVGELSLPTINETLSGGYEWIWQDMNGNAVALTQKVGNPAQTVEYKLHFVSNDPNYNSFTEVVTLTVGKTIVTPTLAVSTFEYTGETLTVSVTGVPLDVEYTVNYLTDFVNVGAHKVELVMAADAYATHSWNGSATDTIILSTTVTASVNTVEEITIAGWTFGATASVPQTTTKFGGEVAYTYYNVNTPNVIEQGLPVNAGTYVLIATSAATDNYASDSKASAQFTIAQATPEVTFETTYTVDWFSGITLNAITLNSECAWVDAAIALEVGNNQTFMAVYTPSDKNYHAIDVEITVNVETATATINGVAASYTHTYNGNAYTLDGITSSHSEATPQFTYKRNGVVVDEIKVAGVYEVTITLAATAHYDAASATTVVTVEKAANAWTQTPAMSKATWVFNTEAGEASAESKFGEVIVEYKLQTAGEAAYAEGQPTDAGNYHVRFRVVGTDDYQGIVSEAIAFTIEQATVSASLVAGSESFVYNDVEYTANVQLNVAGVGFDVTDNKATAVGDYTLTVTLTDANYKFANGTNETTLNFAVTEAQVALGQLQVVNGKHGATAPTASVSRTDSGTYAITIKYYYDVNRDGEYANELSALTAESASGTYYVIAKVESTSNYFGAETEPVEVKIAQADTDESLVQNVYEIEWQENLTLSAITPTGTGTGTFVWVVENGTAATTVLGMQEYTFSVKFTPANKNYAEITIPVTVNVTAMQVTVPTTARLTDGTTTISGAPTYSGKAWTNADSATNDYTISATSATNADEEITVTFALKENRKWADGTTADKTLTYVVQRAQNEITSFNFDKATGAMTIQATYYTEDIVSYYYRNSDDANGEFVSARPTASGTYDVKVVIAQSANYTAAERIFAEAIAFLQVSLTPSISTSGSTYTGEDLMAIVSLSADVDVTITCDNGATVDGNTITFVNAGTYTVTLTLPDDSLALYKWADKDVNVASTTLTFTINSVTNGFADGVSVQDLLDNETHTYNAGFSRNYDGSESKVDLSTKEQWTLFGEPTITYYSVVNGTETKLADGVYPTNAGNYKIYISVAANGNNYGAWEESVALTINKVNTVISTLPTYGEAQIQSAAEQASGYNYETEPKATVAGAATEVAGTFSYGTITFDSKNGGNGTFTLTFTPENASYNVATATVTISLINVAYFNDGTAKTYYGLIEDAITAANAKASSSKAISVYVMPSLGAAIDVRTSITIKQYVSLYIPYDYNNGSPLWKATDARIQELATANSIDSSATNVDTYRVTLINLINGADITIQNGASLYVGGELAKKGVAGKYCEINLGAGSSIECSGTFYCHGYVKEAAATAKHGNQTNYKNKYDNSFDEGRLIKVTATGKLYGGMAIYDLPGDGGSISNLIENGTFPISQFDFPNMQTYVEIASGATFKVAAHLFMNVASIDRLVKEEVTILTSDTSVEAMYYLSSGSIAFEYCPGDVLYTGTGLMRILIWGELTQGGLTLNPGIEITTQDRFTPISYRLNIYINDGATFTTAKKIKFLPGSLLQINAGGCCNINSDVIFYRSTDSSSVNGYGSGKADAKLINNGRIVVGSAGKIAALIETTAADDSAVLDFSACTETSFTVDSPEGLLSPVTITITAEGYFANSSGEQALYQFVAGSTVTSSANGDECWTGAKNATWTLTVSVQSGVSNAVYNYTVYEATDSSGTGSTALTLSSGKVNMADGKYVKIAVSRHESATFADGTTVDPNAWYLVDDNMTVTIVPSEGISVYITTVSQSGATSVHYKVYESATKDGTYTMIQEFDLETTVKISKNYWFYLEKSGGGLSASTFGDMEIQDGPADVKGTTVPHTTKLQATQYYHVHTVKSSSGGGGCFTSDTMITLADGTQKRADQVTLDDTLLVFNHETGKYEAAGIIFIENDGMAEYNVINLTFSDGTTTKLIYEHGLFDITLNKYVYVDEYNCAEFIGHEFAIMSGDSYEAVTLTNAYVAKEYTGCYSLVTVYHLNYFIDGLFSMPGGIDGLFNMFEYGEGLVYDQEKMQADIEEYGLYTYDDFAEYLPYEVYAAFPAPQLKVSVGKGMVTFEEILGYIEKYLVKNEVI